VTGSMPSKRWRALLTWALVLLPCWGGVELLRGSGALQPFELLTHDLLLQQSIHPPTAPARVTLLGIDESDLQRWGWPLDDDTLVQLLERLLRYDVRLIAVDLYRDTPIPPGSERLAELLRREPRIHWIYHFSGAGQSRGVAPPAPLKGSPRAVFNDVLPDPGGVVRRGLLFLDDGAQVGQSLALRMARQWLAEAGVQAGADAAGNLRLGAATFVPLASDDAPYSGVDAAGYQLLLDYRDPRPLPQLSLHQLLSGEPDPALLKGQIVLVGSTAVSSSDQLYAPMRLSGTQEARIQFGVELHARITEQLLRQALGESPVLRGVGPDTARLWLLLWVLLGGLVALRLNSIAPLLGAAGLLLATLYLSALAALQLGWSLPLVAPALALLAAMTLLTAQRVSRLYREQRHLTDLFGRYQSQSVMEALLRDPQALRLGGERREVSVMFTDLRGFSALAERLTPEQVVVLLNHYFDQMVETVHAHEGTILELLGDGMLVVFGAPLSCPDHRLQALRCALAMQGGMHRVNAESQRRGQPSLEMGIGLHCGEVVVGNLGSLKRAKYAVVGSVVNLAARIESYTTGGQILISPSLRDACAGQLRLGRRLLVRPKGFAEPLELTALMGLQAEPQGWLGEHEVALRYLSRPQPLSCALLEGKHVSEAHLRGELLAHAPGYLLTRIDAWLQPTDNLRLKFKAEGGLELPDAYARVERIDQGEALLRLSPLPDELTAYLEQQPLCDDDPTRLPSDS